MKHKEKLRIARRMNGGLKRGAFLTTQWASRAKGIAKKVLKRIKKSSSPKGKE